MFLARYKPTGAAKWQGTTDIIAMTQKEGEDVEDFNDSIIVQRKSFDCTNEQLLQSIMNGIMPDLQESILRKDPDIKDMASLRKVAIFAQACRPATTEVVMAAGNRQQCRARSPSPYRHYKQDHSERVGSLFGRGQRIMQDQSDTLWQNAQHVPRYTQSHQRQQHGQVQGHVAFDTGRQCNFCGGRYHFD